jgi:hypothetical protein
MSSNRYGRALHEHFGLRTRQEFEGGFDRETEGVPGADE